jgi:hypothetical protein
MVSFKGSRRGVRVGTGKAQVRGLDSYVWVWNCENGVQVLVKWEEWRKVRWKQARPE